MSGDIYTNRDKSKNKPEYNIMAKKRRKKAKHDEIARKRNRKCGFNG